MVCGRIDILSGFYDEDTLGLLVICAWDGGVPDLINA